MFVARKHQKLSIKPKNKQSDIQHLIKEQKKHEAHKSKKGIKQPRKLIITLKKRKTKQKNDVKLTDIKAKKKGKED